MATGTCSGCDTPIAPEQRYCIACGLRVIPPVGAPFIANPDAQPAQATPLRPQGTSKWLPVPPQMASAFGAAAIGFGVVIGSAISPGTTLLSAAPSQLAAAPPATTPPAAPLPAGGGGSAPLPPSSQVAAAAVGGSGGSAGGAGGGDGHHKKKKKKQKPAALTVAGTVVHVNPAAHSFAVAAGGDLVSIHADTLPAAGDQLTAQVRKLFNGTYAEDGAAPAPTGTVKAASFTGTITSRDETALTYVVSSRGSSVLVRAPQGTPAAQIPALGARVTATVAIGDPTAVTPPAPVAPPLIPLAPAPCDADGPTNPATPAPTTVTPLTQTALSVDAPDQPTADLEGVVQAVCPSTGELVVSADDARESFMDLTIPVPAAAGIDLSKIAVGQSFNVATAFDPAAKTFSVTGVSSDQGAGGSDDASLGQGSLK